MIVFSMPYILKAHNACKALVIKKFNLCSNNRWKANLYLNILT